MARPLAIGLGQVTGDPYEPARNLELTLNAAEELFDRGARLVVLPELVVSGYAADRERLLEVAEPIDGPAVVRYPSRGRSLRVEYASPDELPAYWGIWINTGGWAGHHHFAVEPTTGRFDQIDRAVADDSAGRLGPLGRLDWTVKWVVGAGRR